MAQERAPAYSIIKDLFDTIDIRKDGIIDLNEWQQTFGGVEGGDNKLTIKPTALSSWENTREFKAIGNLICRNRKVLKDKFDKVAAGGTDLSFAQIKGVMIELLNH